jgi:hypothetical protein
MSIRKRLDGITIISDTYRCVAPPAPKSVKIELSPRCNYKCVYCGYSYRKDTRNDMDFELFKKITKEMKEIGVEEIGVFYIGESFINPKLLTDCVAYLKQELRIPYVFLTSNASLAKPEVVKDLMALGLDSLKWSCNAANDEQFKNMMGVTPAFFDLAKDNIFKAYQIREKFGYHTKLYASSIRYSDEQVAEMQPFLDKYVLAFVDDHYYLPLYTMGGAAKDAEQGLGLKPVPGNPGRWDSMVDPLPCWTVFTAGHVLSDGRLTACCMDATGSWVMGDLKTQKFMDAWNCEDFQKLRQAHLNKDVTGTACEKCALL